MYIRLVAEITSHLFQALTSSLSRSLFILDFLLLPWPRFRLYSLPLSLSPPSFNPQPVYSDKEHEGTVLGRIPSISRNSSEKSP